MRFLQTASALAGLSAVLLSSCTSSDVSLQVAKTPASATWSQHETDSSLPAPADTTLLDVVAHLKKDKHGMPSYTDDQTHRVVRTTAYSHMENEPGAPGRKNAAGGILKYGQVRSAAADWSKYPVGTRFKVKGLPYTYVVDDYGSALTGTNTIDIFHPSLAGMNNWGTRTAEIDVIQWGSWDRTLALLKGRTGYWHCRDMYAAARKRQSSNGSYAKAETADSDQG
jgi:3D (Asp-Asp-Asp) domain-containing protein